MHLCYFTMSAEIRIDDNKPYLPPFAEVAISKLWPDRDVVLIGAGREPLSEAHSHAMNKLAARLPVLG